MKTAKRAVFLGIACLVTAAVATVDLTSAREEVPEPAAGIQSGGEVYTAGEIENVNVSEIEAEDISETPRENSFPDKIPVDFHPYLEMEYYPREPYPIPCAPLDPADVVQIRKEETVGGYRLFTYRGHGGSWGVGLETEEGLYSIPFHLSGELSDDLILTSYDAETFTDILNRSGFKLSDTRGCSSFLTLYFTVTDGVPELIAKVNAAVEADVDSDGQTEVLWWSNRNNVLIKDIDGVVMFSDDLLSAAKAADPEIVNIDYKWEMTFTVVKPIPSENAEVEFEYKEYMVTGGMLVLAS